MKKPNQTIIIMFLIVLLCTVGAKAMKPILIEYYVMTKNLTHIFELLTYFEGTDVLIPQYNFQLDDPYEYTAVERISIERSKQYTKWDGYVIFITPTKLSDSLCYEIIIHGSKSDQTDDSDLEWRIDDKSQAYSVYENLPSGEYKRVVASFQQDSTAYEVTGDIFGPSDEMRIEKVKEELMYIINSMQVVKSVEDVVTK
jgi:hypothetical protein